MNGLVNSITYEDIVDMWIHESFINYPKISMLSIMEKMPEVNMCLEAGEISETTAR